VNYANIYYHKYVDLAQPKRYNLHNHMANPLNWESTFAIALALKSKHPQVNLENVSLGDVLRWTLALEDFQDDPALVNDEILSAIYQDWFEETLNDTQ
jgi:FeS assembly protein IscX